MNQCAKCKEWKNESEFCKNKIAKDGINYVCKQCVKQYYQDNKKEIYEQHKIYYQNNKDKLKEDQKKYRLKHKGRIREYYKEYRIKNKERLKEYGITNKERTKECGKQYRIKNKEKIAEYSRKYIKEHPAENTYRTRKRQMAKLQATPSYADQKAIKRIYRTAHILSEMLKREFHVDHIIPLTHTLVCGLHHQDNLQIISAERNRIKHNKFEPIIT